MNYRKSNFNILQDIGPRTPMRVKKRSKRKQDCIRVQKEI